jgi:hypothetical protein
MTIWRKYDSTRLQELGGSLCTCAAEDLFPGSGVGTVVWKLERGNGGYFRERRFEQRQTSRQFKL